MILTNTSFGRYLKGSASLFYSLLLVLPGLALYEIAGLLLFRGKPFHIRNGVDVLVNRWLTNWGFTGSVVVAIILAVAISYLLVYNKGYVSKITQGELKISYLSVMLLESMAWAVFFILASSLTLQNMLANPIHGDLPELIYLSIGAGIFEELLFRLILVSALYFIFRKVLRESKFRSIMVTVIISGIIFSLFHYLGSFGEVFLWRTFTFRFLSGVFLSLLFLKRGYGVTAYTHIFYDIIIVSLPIINR